MKKYFALALTFLSFGAAIPNTASADVSFDFSVSSVDYVPLRSVDYVPVRMDYPDDYVVVERRVKRHHYRERHPRRAQRYYQRAQKRHYQRTHYRSVHRQAYRSSYRYEPSYYYEPRYVTHYVPRHYVYDSYGYAWPADEYWYW